MTQLKMLSADDKIAEIRRLYFGTSKQTIEADLAKALDLLKSMATEDERERATVYMEGLAEMRNDWVRERAKPAASPARKRRSSPVPARQSPSKARGQAPRSGQKSVDAKNGRQPKSPTAQANQARPERPRPSKPDRSNR